MAKKGIAVGVEITGKDTDYKASVESAKKATDELRKNAAANSRKIENDFKQVTIAMAKIAGAVLVAQKSFEFIKIGMMQTGQGADQLEKFTTKLKSGFDALAGSVYALDFANMINNWKMATKAAGDYADSMDLVDHRLSDLRVRRASVSSSVATLRAKQVAGTLTTAEGNQLKTETQDLLSIESQIYDAAIAAQIKYMAENKGLDATLFKTLEDGINKRALLNTSERENLEGYVTVYDNYVTELKRKYTTIAESVSTGGGIMGNAGQTTFVTDMAKVNEKLSEYLKLLPDVARLQIFEHNIASDPDYKKLVDFYVKRNELQGEYAGLINKTDKALTKLNTTTDKSIDQQSKLADERIDAAWFRIQNKGVANSAFEARMRAANAQIGDVNGYGNAGKMDYSEVAKGNNDLEKQTRLVNSLESAFTSMFLNLDKGWESLGDVILGELKRIFAYMAARAAVWALISLYTGGKGTLATNMGSFSSYVTKMADGGIASKPTLAQIGEYSGASNNPEVVAPLSKLKSLIGTQTVNVQLRGKLLGSDIYLSGMRYTESLYRNT